MKHYSKVRSLHEEIERSAIGTGRKGGWCPVCQKSSEGKVRKARFFLIWKDDNSYDYVENRFRLDGKSAGYLCAVHDRLMGRANLMRSGYDKNEAKAIDTAIARDDETFWEGV